MATWKCKYCGKEVDGRCRPKACPECGAGKEAFEKKE
ncbi:MAG: radical SAM protein [Firmicutes bacterium]|nr:radical SAM protein [Bacillota bacterium]